MSVKHEIEKYQIFYPKGDIWRYELQYGSE
jgi:hypothetical protein